MSAHAIFYKKLQSKSFFYYVFCIICITIVAANIVFSQKYNKNMYGVMNGESVSIVNYLKHIWGTPLYGLEVETYRAEGRLDVLSLWNDVQQANTKRIRILEDATQLHPYAPELYYNLSLLYTENGDKMKAKENLLKAQQIDPSIQ